MGKPNHQTKGHQQQSKGQNHQNQNQLQQLQDSQKTTDVLGNTREVLYGANTLLPNHSDQFFQGQSLHNMSGMQNNSTGQDVGRPIVQPVNAAQPSGPLYQACGGLNGPYGGQNGPYYTNQQINGQLTTDSSVPPWAANLCNQMSNIQIMLDGHSKRWQLIENNMTLQNERLVNMEKKLSEISNIKQELVMTNTKVYSVENELKTMKYTMTENSESINQYSNMYDNLTDNNRTTNQKLRDIEQRVSQVERKQTDTDENMHDTNEKLTDVRWRSMRENLLFFGIEECVPLPENGENCEGRIKHFIKNDMGIDKEILLDRVHRLGRFNKRNIRPRPIVAKFTFFKDRELVRMTAPQVLTGTDYGVSEQYPQEIESKRKPLYSVAKKAKADKNNTVKLIRDKLYINGELYIPKPGAETARRENEDRYGTPYRANTDNTRVQARTYSRGQNVTNRTWPNTYTRSAQNNVQTNYRANEPQIFTNNRFSALAMNTPPNEQTTRVSHAGKKKATSPLEDIATFKRQTHERIQGTSASQIDMDLTQEPSDSQNSPSLLIDLSANMVNRQTPPPIETMETMATIPSPMVSLSDHPSATDINLTSSGGDTQARESRANSACDSDTD